MKIAVMGASGYTGRVLLRLLLNHPETASVLPVSSSLTNCSVDETDPGLGVDFKGKLPPGRAYVSSDDALKSNPDAVFSALPHGISAQMCEPFLESSVVFDLSADLRLKSEKDHLNAYGPPLPLPEKRREAVYGLAEVHHSRIGKANLIAVPGCFPTSILLPLIPLASAGIIHSPITVNSITGISGAGRTPKESSLYTERSENAAAYSPGLLHRHVSEMHSVLSSAGSASGLFFTPHLVPMRRGILSTITFLSQKSVPEAEKAVESLLRDAYAGSPFIQLKGSNLPETKDVAGSNRCDIGWTIHPAPDRTSMVSIISVIDNLLKGASGQAVQDFNIRFGFPESTGLPLQGTV